MSNQLTTEHPDKISINYILSKNRSGSTLLSFILNKHMNVISISEGNIYWLLKKDYGHYSTFSDDLLRRYINDLFFITRNSDKFSAFFSCNKTQLFDIIKSYRGQINYSTLTRIVYLNAYYGHKDISKVSQIINKELQFNPYINNLYRENKKTKFIILTRDPRAIVYSSIKSDMGRNNYVYQAEKWYLEMKPLAFSNVPSSQLLHIKYEDLILNTDTVLKKICSFLELDFDSAMLYNESSASDIIDQLKNNSHVAPEILHLLNTRHTSTFASINPKKINEWETQNAFSEKQKQKIDFICREVSEKFGYTCSSEVIHLTIYDKIQQYLSRLDHYIARNYILLPVKYKRLLRAVNILKFYR